MSERQPLIENYTPIDPSYGSTSKSASHTPHNKSTGNINAIENNISDYDTTDTSNTTNEVTETITFISEVKIVGVSAVPIVMTFIIQYFLAIIPITVLGHIGSLELGAASLAIMTYNITGLGIIQGAVTVLDTFAAQAYGAKKYHHVGEWSQRCFVFICVLLIPMYFVWWFSEPLLNFLQPNKELSILAQRYLRIMSYGTPGLVVFEVTKRFLQSQGIFHPPTYVLTFCAPFSMILTYLLVFTFDFGFIGAPIAESISYLLMGTLLFIYAGFIDGYQCWNGVSKEAMTREIYPMLKLAVPSVCMTLAEYLAFEIMTLEVSYLGTDPLAAQSIASTIGSLVFQIPFAYSCAAATRVSQLIGSMDKLNSIKSSRICIQAAAVLGCTTCTLLFLFAKPIVRIFTKDEVVISIALRILPILFITQCYDTVNVTIAGIFRAQGRQVLGTSLNFICYYLFGTPLSFYLGFYTDLKILGIWIGLSASVILIVIVQIVIIIRTDWDQIFEEAKKRNSLESEVFEHLE
ncbi:hypothetical protein BVG19_g3570 [[Candida] boidinii]|nr:hypothetical protein BVG19_g3570 [[Candida] boidinii]OWB49589.1 hypothetical protein B5S27_g1130 [[Candida] boidinii]